MFRKYLSLIYYVKSKIIKKREIVNFVGTRKQKQAIASKSSSSTIVSLPQQKQLLIPPPNSVNSKTERTQSSSSSSQQTDKKKTTITNSILKQKKKKPPPPTTRHRPIIFCRPTSSPIIDFVIWFDGGIGEESRNFKQSVIVFFFDVVESVVYYARNRSWFFSPETQLCFSQSGRFEQ